MHDPRTVEGFGREWAAFDQTGLDPQVLESMFAGYFGIFPWEALPDRAVGVDVGCGSGRWARVMAERVGWVVCVDPSAQALEVARRVLPDNCTAVEGAAGALPFAANTFDFGYAVGVLHHTPDPQAALNDCVKTMKAGAPFLVYLYYAFDNRPRWYRDLWRLTDVMRRVMARLPWQVRYGFAQAVAVVVYWPLARTARAAERRGKEVGVWPLSIYRDRPLYVMRNDALDRFGTRLERRFTADEVRTMMADAGLVDVRLDPTAPYWVAVGRKG